MIPQFKWAYFSFVIFAVTYFYAIFPTVHYAAVTAFATQLLVISIAYKMIDTEKKLDLVLWGYIVGAFYLSFYIFQLGRNSGMRVEGMGMVDAPGSNALAAAIAPSLVLCLYYYWRFDTKRFKVVFAIAGVFIANAIVLINSRGAFLAVSTSLLYFMFYMYTSSQQKRFQKATAVWLTIVGLAGVVYLADDSFIERMKSISNTAVSEQAESGSTRTVFWKGAWEMAKDYPLGTGASGFQYYAPFYVPEHIHTGRSRNRAVHSTWFEALTEVGYLGLIVFVLMLYSCFKTTNKCKKLLKEKNTPEAYFKVIAIEAAFISFLVSSTFINRYKAELLYWLVLYTACAYNIYVLQINSRVAKRK